MFERIRRWRREQKESKRRQREAWEAFSRKYPDRRLVRSQFREDVLDNGDVVVTVSYDGSIPLRRSWWIIHADGQPPEELPYEKAKELIRIPAWR